MRDWLWGSAVTDIDIATTLTPQQVLHCLKAEGLGAGLAGIAYGTVATQLHHSKVEITTLRQDKQTYGRAAKVEFSGNWQADAERRDFTINAIYASATGRLYDPVGGLADLKRGRVVFIGDAVERILEDNLRVLRFFRFYARFAKTIDPATLKHCVDHTRLIKNLSAERVQGELFKLLALKDPSRAIRLLEAHNILAVIDPGLTNYKRLYAHIKMRFAPDPLTRLVALYSQPPEGKAGEGSGVGDKAGESGVKGKVSSSVGGKAGEGGSASLAKRLKLSNKQTAALEFIHSTKFSKTSWRWTVLQAPSSEAVAKWAELLRTDKLINSATQAELTNPLPAIPIGGKDLIQLGMPPSQEVGKLLTQTIKWWAQNHYKPTKTECIAYAKAKLKP